MRILQIGPIPPEVGGKTRGGVATHLWGLSIHLAERGHNIAILADNFYREKPVIKQKVKIYGISKSVILRKFPKILKHTYFKRVIKLKNYFEGLIEIKSIVKNLLLYDYAIQDFKPEVIHIHHLETRFPFAYFVVDNEIPIVTTIHSFHSIKFLESQSREKYRKLIAKNLKLARSLILVSKFIQNELFDLFGKFRGEIWIINNPVDSSKYYPISKERARKEIDELKEMPLILFCANLLKRKGAHILLEATKLLREREVKLKTIIVGNGPEQKSLQEFVEKNRLTDSVKFVSAKDSPDLLNYYNAADLFVLPSSCEGWGLVYMEAMLCGTPVIGTNITAIPEVVSSEDFGFLIPLDDAKVLADAIERGLKKKWDKKKIVNYANLFDWEKRINEFEKAYISIKSKDYEKTKKN